MTVKTERLFPLNAKHPEHLRKKSPFIPTTNKY